jgi:catechol 2,3-dioxygenase-like lactoylglutathione lyase family enzyme
LNHLTFAVSDLERSISFYNEILGCDLRARWADSAYLEAGSLWLCLRVDPGLSSGARTDYTHIAFDVSADAFEALSDRIRSSATIWKENRSEGASIYFLDPDGHKLELHVGSLASRLAHYRVKPRPDQKILQPASCR